ncbi:MAG TPA: dienelactone hydrolase family protein [Gemmataceae bacterium]|nr:dienelactone hydrolase family protein [Gemmataceae bacterium]
MKKMLVTLALLSMVTVVQGQDFAKKRLENSPRHHDWVQIKVGNRTVHAFVAIPEKKEKATGVIVIHENKGLTEWACGVADQLAEQGYVAIAPDLLSGMGPGGGNTKDFKSTNDATMAIGQLSMKPEQVTADLNAVADFLVKHPACNGKITVSGFCWGGGQSFRFATDRKDLKAAFVFYGQFAQTKENLAKVPCPVYGFYAENDAGINGTIPTSQKLMKELNKTYEAVTYPGAGHGFMRAGEDPAAKGTANAKGRDAAWERWKAILKKI